MMFDVIRVDIRQVYVLVSSFHLWWLSHDLCNFFCILADVVNCWSDLTLYYLSVKVTHIILNN